MSGSSLRSALRLAGIYVAVAGLYIVFSDRLVESLVHDPITLSRVQSTKGIAFVLVTGAMLFGLMRLELALREHSERRAHERDAHFRAMFDTGVVGTALWRVDGTVDDCNQAYAELVGHPRTELTSGRVKLQRLVPPEYLDVATARTHQALREGRCMPFALELVRGDGRRQPVLMALTRVPGGEDRGLTVMLDLSAQRELEGRLLHKQKLEAVGLLAGGVAHDFNNLLTAILGYAELCAHAAAPGSAMERDLGEITAAARRAAALTRQMLAFSRRQVLHPRVIDVDEVVRGLEPLLTRLAGDGVEVATALAADSGRVLVDPGQLEQVLVNLVVNARDAMPAGGRVTLSTLGVHLTGSDVAAYPGARPGPHVAIAVRDEGMGMDASTLEHAFEPFFTTKAPGKGTGLGLATVLGIIEQSGGHVRVASEPRRGSTFTVLLPRATGAPTEEPPARPARVPAAVVNGTVMVIERDDGVRRLAIEVLSTRGYEVLAADSAEAARRLCDSHRGTVDLVLVDSHVPGSAGGTLLPRLRARWPAVPVIVMSGLGSGEATRSLDPSDPEPMLQKPFTPAELLQRVDARVGARG